MDNYIAINGGRKIPLTAEQVNELIKRLTSVDKIRIGNEHYTVSFDNKD